MSNTFLKNNSDNNKSAYIIGCSLGVLVTLIVMLLFATLLLVFNIDRAYAAPFASISIAIGCYVASRITSKKIGNRGYLIGLIIGFIVFVIITVLSLVLGNKLSLNTLFHLIIITLSSLCGGIVGVNATKSKRYI